MVNYSFHVISYGEVNEIIFPSQLEIKLFNLNILIKNTVLFKRKKERV